MSTKRLERRIEDLERTADDGTGGCWPILLVELTDGDDEAAVIAAAYERAGQPQPVTGGGGPIRMVIVDMRTDHDQMEVQGNET